MTDLPDLFAPPAPVDGGGDLPDLFAGSAPAPVKKDPRARLVELSNKEYDSRFGGGAQLSPQETAEYQGLTESTKAEAGHHEQVRQAVRGFMEPDPQLDQFHAARAATAQSVDPIEQGIPAAKQPVISSYADPRFKNFQAKLTARLGHQVSADDAMSMLADQGYGIDQNSLMGGAGTYDPNPLVRAPQQATIGAAKLGANMIDLVGALDPRGTTDVVRQPNMLQQQAAESRQNIRQLEGAYVPNRMDSLYQSVAPLLMSLGPAKFAGGTAARLGASEGLSAVTAGAAGGATQGLLGSPEVYRDSVEHGLTQGQALGNVGASVAIQGAGDAVGQKLFPFRGVQSLAKPAVFNGVRGQIVQAVTNAAKGLPADALEGAISNGATQAMDVVRQAMTTNPNMTVDEALDQVKGAIADGSILGATAGVVHGGMNAGAEALHARDPQIPDLFADPVAAARQERLTRATDVAPAPGSPQSEFQAQVNEARARVPEGQMPDLFEDPALVDSYMSDVVPTQKFNRQDIAQRQAAVADKATEQQVVGRQAVSTDKVIGHDELPDLFAPAGAAPAVRGGENIRGSEHSAGSVPSDESALFGRSPTRTDAPGEQAPGRAGPVGDGKAENLGRSDAGAARSVAEGAATAPAVDAHRAGELRGVDDRSTESRLFGPPDARPAAAGDSARTAGRDAPAVSADRADPGRHAGADAESVQATGHGGPGAGARDVGSDTAGRVAADRSATAPRPDDHAGLGSEKLVPGNRGEVRPGDQTVSHESGSQSDRSGSQTEQHGEAGVPAGPRRLEAGEKAPDGLKRAVDRVNKQLDGLPPLPESLAKNPAGSGSGYNSGNPKYKVPLRPDMTFAEFKARLDPADRQLLDSAKGNPAAAKKLKERFGWSDQHNEISRPYENMQRNLDRGLGGQLQGGTNKNVGRAHQALSEAGRVKPNAERGGAVRGETGAEAVPAADHAAPDRAAASEPGPIPGHDQGVGTGGAAQHRADVPARGVFQLPRELSKIAPRYGYRDQNFKLKFASDFDRATYALANTGTRSKAHTRILEALAAHSGKSESELADHGQKVRDSVKALAKDSYGTPGDELKVPARNPKLAARAPTDFTAGSFSKAERIDPSWATPEHQAAVDLGEHLGATIDVAHLPEHVDGAYDPTTGDVLIGAHLAEHEVARVLGHELTHKAVDALPEKLKAQLGDNIRSMIGEAEANRLIDQAKEKWGDIGDEGLIHEMLADAGGSIVQKRGIGWLMKDRSTWQKVTDWMDRTVTKLRASLGSADAKMRRVAEQIIHDYSNATSTGHQNGANLAYEHHFGGNVDHAIKFAIRDLAEHDDRFLASSEKKLEKVLKPFGAAGAEMAKAGAQIVRRIMSPSYFAGKFPHFGEVFSANRAREEHQVRMLDQVNKLTPTFQKLGSKESAKVNDVLEYQRINKVELSQQQLETRGLSPKQIDAVLEAREATKFLMDERRNSLAHAFGLKGSPTVAAVKAMAAAKTGSEKARLELAAELLDKHDSLIKPGYVPLMRFGEHRKLVVSDQATGAVLHYEHVANARELAEARARIEQNWGGAINGPNAVAHLDIGRIIDRADSESYGFSESDISALAKAAGVSPKILDDFLGAGVREHLMSKGFNRHLLAANDTPGYSKDFKRALASYSLSASHGVSLIRFNADIKKPMQSMAVADQGLHQYATKYKDYVLNRQADGAWLRNLAFMKYLGFNVGSAVTNLTQVPMVTAPFMFALSGRPGAVMSSWKHAGESLAAAFAEVGGNAALAAKFKHPDLDMVELYADHVAAKNPGLATALRAARANGIMTQADARAFTAMAQRGGNTAIGAAGRGFANAASFFFAKSERSVRLATFVAAHKLAEQHAPNTQFWSRANELGYNGKPGDAASFASWTTDETQGIYGKANRPELFRHWATAPAYIFKQFAQTMMTTLYKLSKLGLSEAKNGHVLNAPLGGVAAYFIQSMIAGGIWNALPGGQTLKGVANQVWSSHGGKRDVEVELDKLLGQTGGELVNRGALGFLPGMAGEFGPALGRRAGLGNAIPPLNDAEAIAGPGVSAIADTASDIGLLTSGDPWAQAKGTADLIAGRSGKGLVAAAQAATSSRGIETESGRTLIPQNEVDKTDLAGLALGLPTRHVDEAKRANKAIQDVKAGAGDLLQHLATKHTDALLANDKAGVSEAIQELADHNTQARKSGRTNEIITPQSYAAAIKNEMTQRRFGVLNNRGVPKKAFQQIQELRKSSAGYQTGE